MSTPARSLPEPQDADAQGLPSSLPIIINARDITFPAHSTDQSLRSTDQSLRFIDLPASAAQPQGLANKKEPRTRGGAVLRGIKDLQQLQKQTIAVLESVKGALDEIQQVLRSPEATRGMEKQQNAAMLLAKGFAREAVEQAQGAVSLLPANPEAHLLLSLSLSADQQFDASLAMARKGLALFDRRQHPLAIEAGLLHSLATLGAGAEAVDRWAAIIDSLPLPVLFEQLARIAACFPAESLGGGEALLDDFLHRRLARDEQTLAAQTPADRRQRFRDESGKIDIRPDEFPAPALFAGLDAAHDHALPCTHRAVLAQIARRLQLTKDSGDVVKFLTECLVPLANRGLDRSASALGRASVKRLLRFHADVPTLHRALQKLELAAATVPQQEIASLLNHWRLASGRRARAQRFFVLAAFMLTLGVAHLCYVLFSMNGGGAMAGKSTLVILYSHRVDAIWAGPAMMLLGSLVGIAALFGRTWHVAFPENRPALSAEERAYLRGSALRQSLRSAFNVR